MTSSLRFRENGEFTIVQFTDLHWKNGEEPDQRTLKLMAAILDAERPDLVVFTGDVIHCEETVDPYESFRCAVSATVERQIPWAAVFGNHDAERGASRAELVRFQQQLPGCLTQSGPEEIDGIGNYVLPILAADGRQIEAVLYLLDSGSYAQHRIQGWNWIRRSQIDWYVRQSTALTDARSDGRPVPALAFFHIPLPEYSDLWDFKECYGHNYEGVGSPRINSGLFAAMLEMDDVMGVFVGHDHVNDYWGMHHGIKLCYGRATGYSEYGKEGFPRGARIIRLQAGERTFSTWLRLDDGAVITNQPLHSPEGTRKNI